MRLRTSCGSRYPKAARYVLRRRLDVSIVIPLYQEAGNVLPLAAEIIESLAHVPWTWELILADDGSTDGTRGEMSAAAMMDLRIRTHFDSINRGQSAAFARGFSAARGRLIVTMDGDLQIDPADIPLLVRLADAHTSVCGIRVDRNDHWGKRFSSRIANWIRSRVLSDGVVDTGCPLKVMPRRHLLEIPQFRGAHRFYPALLQQRGVAVRQVPVRHRPRMCGASKYGFWNRALNTLIDLLGVAWLASRSFPQSLSSWSAVSYKCVGTSTCTGRHSHTPSPDRSNAFPT